jgi:hypothetical protein
MSAAPAERPPEPGEPGYMAWIAELSARLGSLGRAFAYAVWWQRKEGR